MQGQTRKKLCYLILVLYFHSISIMNIFVSFHTYFGTIIFILCKFICALYFQCSVKIFPCEFNEDINKSIQIQGKRAGGHRLRDKKWPQVTLRYYACKIVWPIHSYPSSARTGAEEGNHISCCTSILGIVCLPHIFTDLSSFTDVRVLQSFSNFSTKCPLARGK